MPASEFVKTNTIRANTRLALLHTRHYTKGKPDVDVNNHPVSSNTCYVVHNGAIANDDELVKEFKYEARRIGEVDSWAIPMVLSHFDAFKNTDNLKKALESFEGSMAIAAVDPVNYPNKQILAKGTFSPLNVLTTPQGIFWSSEDKALREAWGTAVGTPMIGTANKLGDLGWHTMQYGEAWMIDLSGERTLITRVDFKPAHNTKPLPNTSGHTGTGNYTPYRKRASAWTCWPNNKDCIFGDDCGNCENNRCDCWEGNNLHPSLNKDVGSFKAACDKYANFKSHCDRYKLREEVVTAYPVSGVLPFALAKPTVVTTPGSGQPKTISTSTSASREPTATSKCFFCDAVQSHKLMRKLETKIPGVSDAWECTGCQSQTGMSGSAPVGHDEALDEAIAQWTKDAVVRGDIHDLAVRETAWEFRVAPSFVELCVFWRSDIKTTADKELAKLAAGILTAYQTNFSVLSKGGTD